MARNVATQVLSEDRLAMVGGVILSVLGASVIYRAARRAVPAIRPYPEVVSAAVAIMGGFLRRTNRQLADGVMTGGLALLVLQAAGRVVHLPGIVTEPSTNGSTSGSGASGSLDLGLPLPPGGVLV
jgi:hypothetical protein